MIIRWTSIGTVTALAIASIDRNPNEMFGKRAVHHIDVDQVGVLVDHPDVRLQIEKIAG